MWVLVYHELAYSTILLVVEGRLNEVTRLPSVATNDCGVRETGGWNTPAATDIFAADHKSASFCNTVNIVATVHVVSSTFSDNTVPTKKRLRCQGVNATNPGQLQRTPCFRLFPLSPEDERHTPPINWLPRKPTRYLFRICQFFCPNFQKLQTLSSRYIQEKEFKKQLWLRYAFMKNRSSTWKTSRHQSVFLNRSSMSIYRYISRLETWLTVSQISS